MRPGSTGKTNPPQKVVTPGTVNRPPATANKTTGTLDFYFQFFKSSKLPSIIQRNSKTTSLKKFNSAVNPLISTMIQKIPRKRYRFPPNLLFNTSLERKIELPF